ncbi:helix-turn-helix domain-containing protein [Kitasatospora sp. NPDC048239]|uniref:helix-turn-helix domain-containing protein n=1 Tax=Kitasatospora sp. NPDC048239 TaxID=3364046 RepID=UPI00370FD974
MDTGAPRGGGPHHLTNELGRLITDSGGPSQRTLLRKGVGKVCKRSTLSRVLRGQRPKREVVKAIARACGQSEEAIDEWGKAWDRVYDGRRPPIGPPPNRKDRGHPLLLGGNPWVGRDPVAVPALGAADLGGLPGPAGPGRVGRVLGGVGLCGQRAVGAAEVQVHRARVRQHGVSSVGGRGSDPAGRRGLAVC